MENVVVFLFSIVYGIRLEIKTYAYDCEMDFTCTTIHEIRKLRLPITTQTQEMHQRSKNRVRTNRI